MKIIKSVILVLVLLLVLFVTSWGLLYILANSIQLVDTITSY